MLAGKGEGLGMDWMFLRGLSGPSNSTRLGSAGSSVGLTGSLVMLFPSWAVCFSTSSLIVSLPMVVWSTFGVFSLLMLVLLASALLSMLRTKV